MHTIHRPHRSYTLAAENIINPKSLHAAKQASGEGRRGFRGCARALRRRTSPTERPDGGRFSNSVDQAFRKSYAQSQRCHFFCRKGAGDRCIGCRHDARCLWTWHTQYASAPAGCPHEAVGKSQSRQARTHTHTHAHTHTQTQTHPRARARARAHAHNRTHTRSHKRTRTRTRVHKPTHTRAIQVKLETQRSPGQQAAQMSLEEGAARAHAAPSGGSQATAPQWAQRTPRRR